MAHFPLHVLDLSEYLIHLEVYGRYLLVLKLDTPRKVNLVLLSVFDLISQAIILIVIVLLHFKELGFNKVNNVIDVIWIILDNLCVSFENIDVKLLFLKATEEDPFEIGDQKQSFNVYFCFSLVAVIDAISIYFCV